MLSKLTQNTKQFVTDNATTILTAVGVTGTATTGVLSYRAGFRSATILEEERRRHDTRMTTGEGSEWSQPNPDISDPDTMGKFKLVWPEFVPPVGACALTISSILFSHKMNAGRAATLAAAYSMSESKYREYRDRINLAKNEDEMDKINEEFDTEQKHKPQVVYMGGEVLCLDMLTGRYFQSTAAEIHQAVGTLNHEILTHGFASVGMFFSELGLPDTDLTEDMGWNSDTIVEVKLSSEITPDGRPAIVLNFLTAPKPDFR